MKLPTSERIFTFIILATVIALGLSGYTFYKLFMIDQKTTNINEIDNKVKTLQNALVESNKKQEDLASNFDNMLYEDHIKLSESIKLNAEIESLENQLKELSSKKDNADYLKITQVYTIYNQFTSKIKRNTDSKLKTTDYENKILAWGTQLLNKDYDTIIKSIDESISTLDSDYKAYLATLPPPATKAGEGYSYTTVTTNNGKFGVYLLKVSLSSVKVVTASANGSDCKDNCPTKSLADHIKDNGGYAGMNGTYFCPPDYSSCSGKTNSFDYAFYKSSDSKWLNKNALSWGDTGLATFNGHSAKFYKKTSEYSGSSVSAGISNFPTLLKDGNNVIDNRIVTEYQKLKGRKGAIGKDDANLYLALINSATIYDAADVMKSLGAKDALNIDGGGSSAMYVNGSYVVGPGRSLPNAIVLVK